VVFSDKQDDKILLVPGIIPGNSSKACLPCLKEEKNI
jgi:hypothetical protein